MKLFAPQLLRWSAAVFSLAVSMPGCITPREKKDMQNDVFNVQTRLLTLERQVTDANKDLRNTGESAAKRVASAQSDLDRVYRELQQMRGEIDALRIGVTTGQMPGAAAGEGSSVAASLSQLSERMEAVEQSQEELLEALKKAGVKGQKKAKKSIASVDELQAAFDDKHFKQVVEDAPKLTKEGSAGEKEQARFLLAEAYYKLGKMREAALRYNDFIDAKPSAKFLPLAKMRIGDCFRNLGDVATAKVYYEELIKEFPKSDEAAKAKERLAGGASESDKG